MAQTNSSLSRTTTKIKALHFQWIFLFLVAKSSLTLATIVPQSTGTSNSPQERQSASTNRVDLLRPLQNPLALYLSKDISLASSRQIEVPKSNHTTAQTISSKSSRQKPNVRRRRQQQRAPQNFLAYYYFIQALGKSDNYGCKHTQPSFTATCPVGAFIVSQSSKSEWQSRLDCTQISDTSIHCVPKQITEDNADEIDFEDQNGATIACYGYYNFAGDSADETFDPWENLQVSVQVEPGSYYCDKALEVKTVPHPTVITGGSVYQTVAIQKQCYQSAQEESWMFVEPSCGRTSLALLARDRGSGGDDLFQTTEVPVVYPDDGGSDTEDRGESSEQLITTTTTIAHCEMEDGCAAEYSCSPRCAGKDSCHVDLPGFITTSTSDFTIPTLKSACMPRDFVMDLNEGEPCEFNLMCSSSICIAGVCAPQRLDDHEICEEGRDCVSQACGKHPPNETAPIEPADIPNTTCCPSGSTFGHQGESYCTGSQPIGAVCHEDAMCSTDICIFNTCREALLVDDKECEEDSDCVGGVCGTYHNEGTHVCCPTGDSIYLGEAGPWCSNRPAGDACENNANSICKSNICVEGFCQGIEQDVGAVCDNHFDCKNSACALKSPDPSANQICCPTGEYVFQPHPGYEQSRKSDDGGGPNSIRVCTGQPEGAYCSKDKDLDSLCASGYCIDGTCRASRLAASTDCLEDEDCENQVCAWPSLTQESNSKICCPSNDHKHVYVPASSSSGGLVDVCTGQPLRAPCGDHNIHVLCDSGFCFDGFCHEPNQP